MAIKTILLRRGANQTDRIGAFPNEVPKYGEAVFAGNFNRMSNETYPPDPKPTGYPYQYTGKCIVVGDGVTDVKSLPRFDAVKPALSRLEVFHKVVKNTAGDSEDSLVDIDGNVLDGLGGKVKKVQINGVDILDFKTKIANIQNVQYSESGNPKTDTGCPNHLAPLQPGSSTQQQFNVFWAKKDGDTDAEGYVWDGTKWREVGGKVKTIKAADATTNLVDSTTKNVDLRKVITTQTTDPNSGTAKTTLAWAKQDGDTDAELRIWDYNANKWREAGGKVKTIKGAGGTNIVDATTKNADMYKIIYYGDSSVPASAIIWVKTDGTAQIRDTGGTWHKIFAVWG